MGLSVQIYKFDNVFYVKKLFHLRDAENAERKIFLQIGRCRSGEKAPPCRQPYLFLNFHFARVWGTLFTKYTICYDI